MNTDRWEVTARKSGATEHSRGNGTIYCHRQVWRGTRGATGSGTSDWIRW